MVSVYNIKQIIIIIIFQVKWHAVVLVCYLTTARADVLAYSLIFGIKILATQFHFKQHIYPEKTDNIL